MKYDFIVVIMRLQPIHKAHLKTLSLALAMGKHVIVVFGSHRSAPNVKNPWTDRERAEMVMACLDDEDKARVTTLAVRDYPYHNEIWLAEVQNKVNEVIRGKRPVGWSDYDTGDVKVALMGHKKDRSSFYLDLFPQWDFVETGSHYRGLNATDIRSVYLIETGLAEYDIALGEKYKTYEDLFYRCGTVKWRALVPPQIVPLLDTFQKTPLYKRLQGDAKYYLDYKAKWEGTPFPVTFTTVDSVVIKNGHVLMVKRRIHPGKGLYALPGGFINQNEWILDAAVRELQEETRIKIDPTVMKTQYLKDQHVFDNPDRSLRGRVITHAFYFRLPDGGPLPEVRGADDAELAVWVPLGDLGHMEEQLFEDHGSIIQFFIWK